MLVEPVSGADRYPLLTAADAVAVIDRVAGETGVANLGLLCDLYHLAVNGDDLDQAIAAYAGRVAHVQIADAPGRHEPGTGTLDLDRHLADLAAAGYAGWVGLEYTPSGASADSFGCCPASAADAAPTRRERHDNRRLRRPRHHGRPDGRQPGQGRFDVIGHNRSPSRPAPGRAGGAGGQPRRGRAGRRRRGHDGP